MTDSEKLLYGWDSPDAMAHHAYVFPGIERLLSNKRPLRILDVGCGNGHIASQLAALGHHVIGIDASEVIEHLYNLAISLVGGWDRHLTVDWEGGHIKFFSERTLVRMLEGCGFANATFSNAGRLPWLWKSMICRAEKA